MASADRLVLTVRVRGRSLLRWLLAAWQALRTGEVLTGGAFALGWLLVTWGVASLLVWQVWPISAGLLLVSLGGWRLAWTIVTRGLYALTRGESP